MTRRLARRASLPRLVIAVLVALLATVGGRGVALAHANLVRSNPPAGVALDRAPATVQLWFSEEVEPGFSRALVYDASRRRVDRGDSHVAPDDPRSLVVSLDPNLPNGSYLIAWEAQSRVDGHITRGIVPFGIGVAAPAPAPDLAESLSSGAVSGSPFELTLRWLGLLASTALVGAFAFWILQAEATGRAVVTPGQSAVAQATWAIFLAASATLLVEQAAVAADVPLLGALGQPVLQLALETRYGYLFLARLLLGLSLGGLLIWRGAGQPLHAKNSRPGADRASPIRAGIGLAGEGRRVSAGLVDRLALAVGALLLASLSLSSHSAAMGSLAPLGVANDWLHLVAVAVWVGGLAQLSALVPSLIQEDWPGERAAELGRLVGRFAVVAGLALGALGFTGLVAALLHVGTLDNLLTTGYGQALLAKLLLILPLLSLAAINHFVMRPGLAPTGALGTPLHLASVRATVALFRWTVRLETLFAAAVIAAAGVMTGLAPAQQPGSASVGPLTATAPAGDLVATFTLVPGAPGVNRYVVDLRDAGGRPAAATGVRLRLTYLDSNLGVAEVPLDGVSPGRFAGQSADLAVAGRWETEIVIRRAGQADVAATLAFEVTPAGARALETGALPLGWQFYLGLAIAIAGAVSIWRGVSLRQYDLRRAVLVALCGLCLGVIGGLSAARDLQQAQAEAASQVAALVHPATAESIANGAAIYRANCAVCHGVTARGDGPLAPSLNPRPSDLIVHVPQHPDADLENWIANGFPGSAMPAFKAKLTEQERWDVLNYLKSQVAASRNGSG